MFLLFIVCQNIFISSLLFIQLEKLKLTFYGINFERWNANTEFPNVTYNANGGGEVAQTSGNDTTRIVEEIPNREKYATKYELSGWQWKFV